MRLWYAFLPDPAKVDELHDDGRMRPFKYHQPDLEVKVGKEQLDDATELDEATKFFKENMHCAHLHLTTGPVFQTHHTRRVGKRKRLRDCTDCFDAREQGYITFEPFEVLTILTNERIRLDGETAALVTPRVTNTDAGLIVTTAYIDPYYEGIMRVVVCNMTRKRQTLYVLEPIAQCFFFGLAKGAALRFYDDFAEKTKFFKHTWKHVLASDREPFPRQKRPNAGPGSSDAFDHLVAHVEELRAEVSSLNARLPVTGNIVVRIAAGEITGRKVLTEIVPTSESRVWLGIDHATASPRSSEIDLTYKIIDLAGESRIEISAELTGGVAVADVNVPVLWIVTPEC
jgi:deoxycytidine triphosphate deaminase